MDARLGHLLVELELRLDLLRAEDQQAEAFPEEEPAAGLCDDRKESEEEIRVLIAHKQEGRHEHQNNAELDEEQALVEDAALLVQ